MPELLIKELCILTLVNRRNLQVGNSLTVVLFRIHLVKIDRLASPKFGHPALSLEFQNYAFNTEFVAAVGILLEKLHHHLKAEIISILTVHYRRSTSSKQSIHIFAKLFYSAIIKNLTQQVSVRTLDRVSNNPALITILLKSFFDSFIGKWFPDWLKRDY